MLNNLAYVTNVQQNRQYATAEDKFITITVKYIENKEDKKYWKIPSPPLCKRYFFITHAWFPTFLLMQAWFVPILYSKFR